MEETQKHVMEVNLRWGHLGSKVNGEAKKQRRRMNMKLRAGGDRVCLLSFSACLSPAVIVTVHVAVFWTSSGCWWRCSFIVTENCLQLPVQHWLYTPYDSCRSSTGVVYMAITEVVPPGPENEIWHDATSFWALKMEIRRKWLLSILSLVTARNEPRNRTESQKNVKTVHPAQAALCSHSCHLELIQS